MSENTMIRVSISISKSDFVENIQIKEKHAKYVNDFVKTMDDEDFLEGYYITLSGSKPYTYTEIWLFNINKDESHNTHISERGMYPVYIEDINTSSPHAMWMSSFLDYDEEQNEEITKEEFLELLPAIFRKSFGKIVDEVFTLVTVTE